MPNKGDYLAVDIGAERAMVVRGADGIVRGFHNLCRHRGSRVVADEQGTCNNALVCPFHGWVYNLDGTLRGAARPNSFSEFDKSDFGLKPIETEIWKGFIFIRLFPGPQPAVAELMAPVAEEFGHYHSEDVIPAGAFWTHISPVNWKSVRDVDNEGYHVAMPILHCRICMVRPILTNRSSTALTAHLPLSIPMPDADGVCATMSK